MRNQPARRSNDVSPTDHSNQEVDFEDGFADLSWLVRLHIAACRRWVAPQRAQMDEVVSTVRLIASAARAIGLRAEGAAPVTPLIPSIEGADPDASDVLQWLDKVEAAIFAWSTTTVAGASR
jgi:hypothetical protein